jgi:hypothetical protein
MENRKVGDAGAGGGGAGMGGAIFNQGELTLERVTLRGNSAKGGSPAVVPFTLNGGGMGADAGDLAGGGFGGPPLGVGGTGGVGVQSAGGGGGGFLPGANGTSAVGESGGSGGGLGLLGGSGGGKERWWWCGW